MDKGARRAFERLPTPEQLGRYLEEIRAK